MQITKTINTVQSGDFVPEPDIVINLGDLTFSRGFRFIDSESVETEKPKYYPGTVGMKEILAMLTAAEKEAVIKFIKVGSAMCGNNAISPDTDIKDSDIMDKISV